MICNCIMAVKVDHRNNKAVEFQEILTKHGCLIKLRIGIHETGNFCAEDGLILLQLSGEEEAAKAFKAELEAVDGLTVRTMSLNDL
jgi:hypothetical protein